jgi:hypothetical protein
MTPSTATVVSVLVGTVLPWLTGRAVRIAAHPRVRGAVLLILTLVASVVTELGTAISSGAPYNLWQVLLDATWAYVLSVALHTGIYRHTALYQRNAATGGIIGPATTALN